MADATTPIAAAAAASESSTLVSSLAGAGTMTIYGFHLNLMGIAIGLAIVAILFLFWRIQASEKLDFADMITKDGRAVSLTKILQLIGGVTATWIMIKLTLTGDLTEALFGLYLTYVGAIEGYSKFVAAKYNYNEKSVKDAVRDVKADIEDDVKPPKD